MKNRCPWQTKDELLIKYHDEEWGVPVHDDRLFFEHLILDCMQAGLSWLIILKKRENFRKAFDNFDPEKIARYSQKKIQKLLKDEGIIRNKLKINAVVSNAKSFLQIQEEFGSFDKYIWRFVDGKPKKNEWKNIMDLPVSTVQSDAMSEDLKSRGFKFVGTTICYAFMQAAGLINDHIIDCFRYKHVYK